MPEPLSAEQLESYMLQSLELAREAFDQQEVPVGAIVVQKDQVVGSAFNRTEGNTDPTAHAEILAIRQAAGLLRKWRLTDCLLCVTLEPCPMCASAILQARIPVVVFGAHDKILGAFGSLFDLTECGAYPNPPRVISGVQELECSDLLKAFFQERRS